MRVVAFQLSPRQLCDVELITNGGFSPLTGFMDEETYMSVVNDVKLPSGLLFSLPVVFDTDSEEIQPGAKVCQPPSQAPGCPPLGLTASFVGNATDFAQAGRP